MHRPVALCLVAALLELSGLSANLHVHAYGDHDHPEHQHGFAAHEHHAALRHHDDHDSREWSRCDPAEHRTPVRFVATASASLDISAIALETPSVLIVEPHNEPRVLDADVRVHGPPDRRQSSPRAPPLVVPRSIT